LACGIVRQVANNLHSLDDTFHALADPTRRQVLERLSRSPATVTELAEPFDMALPSLLQHLKVLERSHLVSSEKIGRVRTFQLVPQQIESAELWLKAQRDGWERRLNQFDSYVKELAIEEEHDD
jgi:DNA-binding transcriptional ArsR family regulator